MADRRELGRRQRPVDFTERRQARAFQRFLDRYLFEPQLRAETIDDKLNAAERMHAVIERYVHLSIEAAANGVPDEERAGVIKKGMIAQGLINGSDPSKANTEFTVISEGYASRPDYWNEKMERMERHRAAMQRVPQELKDAGLIE